MPSRIQPVSLALGLVLGVFCFLAMGQATVPTPLRVEYRPHPRDMVTIKGSLPFTVPTGRILIVTALGSTRTDASNYVALQVDGQDEVTHPGSPGTVSSVEALPVGLRIDAGSIVTMLNGNGQPNVHGRAWGYLADQ